MGLSNFLPPLNTYLGSTGAGSFQSPAPATPAAPPPKDSNGGGGFWSNFWKGVTNAATGGASEGVTIQRVVVIVLGLIIIAAGIFMLKSVRETVVTTVKEAGTAAAA